VAVDAAEASLLIDSARLYGLIEGGPRVNVRRCQQMLDLGRAQGHIPTEDGVDATIREFLEEFAATTRPDPEAPSHALERGGGGDRE
jgi:hypothetical protein